MKQFLFSLVVATLAIDAAASCYSVYDRNDRMTYQSTSSPVDLSRPIGDQVRAIWPDSSLVITPDSVSCRNFDVRLTSNSAKSITATTFDPHNKARASIGLKNLDDVLANMDERGVYEPAETPAGKTAGSEVPVRSYTRKDGTTVRAHTRGAPGSRSAGRGK